VRSCSNRHPSLPFFLGEPDKYPLTREPPFIKTPSNCPPAVPFDNLPSVASFENLPSTYDASRNPSIPAKGRHTLHPFGRSGRASATSVIHSQLLTRSQGIDPLLQVPRYFRKNGVVAWPIHKGNTAECSETFGFHVRMMSVI